jgi:prefoldin subunit 5
MSYYSDKDYGILHDHMSAIARERDWLQLEVQRLSRELALVNETLLETLTFEQAIKVMDGLKK